METDAIGFAIKSSRTGVDQRLAAIKQLGDLVSENAAMKETLDCKYKPGDLILSEGNLLVLVDEEVIIGIRDTLQDLMDNQNGCPLPKYQEAFDRTNDAAAKLIDNLGSILRDAE